MPLFRSHFGALAGGLEHALALATLAHAVQPNGGTVPAAMLPSNWRHPSDDVDLFSRLVTLLQDVVGHSGYTIDDLRREGFAEPVLLALESRPSVAVN